MCKECDEHAGRLVEVFVGLLGGLKLFLCLFCILLVRIVVVAIERLLVAGGHAAAAAVQ